jgi:signal peptidase I
MQRTIMDGDLLLVNRAAFGTSLPFVVLRVPGYAQPANGDLVFVRLGNAKSRAEMVKRVVGLPGERIEMRDATLLIDGTPVFEPYTVLDGALVGSASRHMRWQLEHLDGVESGRYFPTNDDWGPLLVPEDQYFVLGDNRRHSIDSRELGFIARKQFVGRVERVLLSHDGRCCSPNELWSGLRLHRVGLDLRPSPSAGLSRTTVTKGG